MPVQLAVFVPAIMCFRPFSHQLYTSVWSSLLISPWQQNRVADCLFSYTTFPFHGRFILFGHKCVEDMAPPFRRHKCGRKGRLSNWRKNDRQHSQLRKCAICVWRLIVHRSATGCVCRTRKHRYVPYDRLASTNVLRPFSSSRAQLNWRALSYRQQIGVIMRHANSVGLWLLIFQICSLPQPSAIKPLGSEVTCVNVRHPPASAAFSSSFICVIYLQMLQLSQISQTLCIAPQQVHFAAYHFAHITNTWCEFRTLNSTSWSGAMSPLPYF